MAGNLGELLVRIGADIKPLEREIRQAERALSRASANFAAWGEKLTLSLTLPIAGLGVAALKSAGQIESLEKALSTTMQAAGRSAGDAAKEMEALRKAAEAPGLDFEQAIKGSVRLQNVGFSAEKAREILVQLANAVAMSGGSAKELDGVTRQFGQMIAKGRVMQEDLTIIQENMPAVSAAMEKAFGTKSAERLREMGVSAEKFVDGVTKQLALLPRVEGGIANAVVNAEVAIKLSLAKIGKEIDKAFDVRGNLERFATWIVGLADSFAALDEDTKRIILGVAVFAASLGPLLKLMQGFVYVAGLARLATLELQKALIQSLSGNIPTLIQRWRALDFAMKASVIGATIAVVAALALAFKTLEKDMSSAAQMARTVADVNTRASQAIVEERKQVDDLIGTLNSHNATREQQRAALQKLQEIAPAFFGNLKIEKGLVKGLAEAQAKYNEALLLGATAKIAAEEYAETQRKILDATGRSADATATWQQSLWNAAKSMALLGPGFGKLLFDQEQATTATENYGRQTGELIAQRERYRSIEEQARAKLAEMTGGVVEATKKTDDFNTATKETVKTAQQIAEVMRDWKDALNLSDVLGAEAFDQQAEAVQGTIKKLIDLGLSPLSWQIQQVKKEARDVLGVFANVPELPAVSTLPTPGGVTSQAGAPKLPGTSEIEAGTIAMTQYMSVAEQLGVINTKLQNGFLSVGESFQQAAAAIAQSGNLIQQSVFAAVGAMEQSAASGETSLKKFALSAVSAAAKVVRAYIQQGVAAAAFKALSSVPFPFNIAAATAAGAIAGTLFNKLISSIGIPALAQGGITTGPTLALVGDNPGGREAIVPLDRLDSMLRNRDAGVGSLVAVVSGDDLHFILERADRRKMRTRGR